MRKSWTLRAIGLSAIAMIGAAGGRLPALTSGTNLLPMIVTNVTGDLHIQQSLPGTCDNVNQTTPLTAGRLELSPATGIDVPGGKQFVLTRASATFAPFTIERHCMAQDVTRFHSAAGVHLSRTTSFTAAEIAPGVYAFTIPKDDVQFFEGSIVNGSRGTRLAAPETGRHRHHRLRAAQARDAAGRGDQGSHQVRMRPVRRLRRGRRLSRHDHRDAGGLNRAAGRRSRWRHRRERQLPVLPESGSVAGGDALRSRRRPTRRSRAAWSAESARQSRTTSAMQGR